VPELAALLNDAFANEPPFTWLQPDDQLRARVQHAMFNGALRCVYPVERGAEALVGNGVILGAAIWTPPDAWRVPSWQQLRVVPGLLRALGIRHFREYARRASAVDGALQRVHPTEPHWYLASVGVAPDAQGKGVGSALLGSGVERCDREGAYAYLECFERLVPYYEQFGFERTGEIEMPDEVPQQVSMLRTPR
jgi:ribosomal protein S18 acetylase RimI-like enzyme